MREAYQPATDTGGLLTGSIDAALTRRKRLG